MALVTPLEPGASCHAAQLQNCRAAELQISLLLRTYLRMPPCCVPRPAAPRRAAPPGPSGSRWEVALARTAVRARCVRRLCESGSACRVDASMLPRLVWRCCCRRGQTCAGHCSFLLLLPTDPSHTLYATSYFAFNWILNMHSSPAFTHLHFRTHYLRTYGAT